MARHLWLTDSKDFNKVADANLAVGDQIQQPESCGVGQRTEKHVERRVFLCLSHRLSVTHPP